MKTRKNKDQFLSREYRPHGDALEIVYVAVCVAILVALFLFAVHLYNQIKILDTF